jgi:hypothetical protein
MTGEPMPEEVRATLLQLRGALDAAVPAKLLDRNLLIATWRWPMVTRISDRWVDDTNAAIRDQRAVHLLAEVAKRFDVLAIQGLMADAPSFRAVVDVLGPDWAYLMTGLSRETTYSERTAVLFDTRKVLPHGLAGQIVIPLSGKRTSPEDDFLSDQFFRPPFFAGFRCLGSTFTLVNQHIVFGTMPERVREIQALGVWLREMRAGAYWEGNLVVLGQLQLIRPGTPTHRAFTAAGLRVPPDLEDAPTYVNSTGHPVSQASSIAWTVTSDGEPDLSLPYRRGGVFNHCDAAVLGDLTADLDYLSRHLTMWTEFAVVPSWAGPGNVLAGAAGGRW